jgi:hypothetical protein
VPAADDLVAVGYVLADAEPDSPALSGDLTPGEDGTWSTTVDASALQGTVSFGLLLQRSGGWTEETTVAGSAPRAVDAAELTAESRGSVTVPPTAVAGTDTTVSGLEPGAWYYTWWFSSPTAGGWVQADATGTATATLPAALAPGSHAVALLDRRAALVGWAPLTVVSPGGGSAGGGGAARLATTGADLIPLWAGGAALLLLGAAAALAATRRPRRA